MAAIAARLRVGVVSITRSDGLRAVRGAPLLFNALASSIAASAAGVPDTLSTVPVRQLYARVYLGTGAALPVAQRYLFLSCDCTAGGASTKAATSQKILTPVVRYELTGRR